MKESAEAALSYVRSHAEELGVEPGFFEKTDIHIHVPSGAIPKDGPSAGVTIVVSLVSMLTGVTSCCDVAMTGEITLRGKILPVGGIKEKVLAARRTGIHEIILPAHNKKDLIDIPKPLQENMVFHFVDDLDEALRVALKTPLAASSHKREV